MHFALITSFGLFLVLVSFPLNCRSDNNPGFFLKVTKNVPRLGRRSGSEVYFLKNTKAIPRIGRRNSNYLDEQDLTQLQQKRLLIDPVPVHPEQEYSVVHPMSSNTLIELLNKKIISTDNIKFVHWKDFDRALQLDMDLYEKLISLGRIPDQHLKDDLNYDIGASYMPLMPNANNDFLFHNKAKDGTFTPKYERAYLRYNYLK